MVACKNDYPPHSSGSSCKPYAVMTTDDRAKQDPERVTANRWAYRERRVRSRYIAYLLQYDGNDQVGER